MRDIFPIRPAAFAAERLNRWAATPMAHVRAQQTWRTTVRVCLATFIAAPAINCGQVSDEPAWHCSADNVNKTCTCRPLDAGVAKGEIVASCTNYPCCFASQVECRCFADLLGTPLEDCNLIQVPGGVPTKSCPP
jgi:hypothetical protein